MHLPQHIFFPRIGLCIAAALLISACATMPEQQVTSLIDVPEEQALLVGRVMISPPLQPGEQVLKTSLGKQFENIFILYAGEQIRDLKLKRPDTYEGSYQVAVDKTFHIRVNKGKTIYISGGFLYTLFDPPYNIEAKTFPALYKVDVNTDDQVVYIGTLQFFRNEHGNFAMAAIRDDFKAAAREFRENFTISTTPRKALLIPFNIIQ